MGVPITFLPYIPEDIQIHVVWYHQYGSDFYDEFPWESFVIMGRETSQTLIISSPFML